MTILNSGTSRFLRSLIGWALAVGLFAAWGTLHAQNRKGALAGEVLDPQGAVVSNASVTVASQDTHETRVTTTDSAGSFRIEAIDPGTWGIHVDAPGFQSFDAKN